MSNLIDTISAHRAAWQAFQDAPADEHHDETIRASCRETEALMALARAVPVDQQDMQALKAHLEWWTIEEAQRRDCEPEPFALYAIIRLTEAREREACALIADAYAEVNWEQCTDSILLDPVLSNHGKRSLTQADWAKAESMAVDSTIHSSMYHAATNVAAAIRKRGEQP